MGGGGGGSVRVCACNCRCGCGCGYIVYVHIYVYMYVVYPRVTSDVRHSFAELREHAECIRWLMLLLIGICWCV